MRTDEEGQIDIKSEKTTRRRIDTTVNIQTGAISTKEDLNGTIAVKVKNISIIFRRMLDKENNLASKTRIISGDCYIDIYHPSTVWRSRGKKHLKLVGMLSSGDTEAVLVFFRKVLPAAEKKVLEEHVAKVMSSEVASTRAPSQAPSKTEKMCLSTVSGTVVKCPDYSDCWDGLFLKDTNKCGHKASPRPRSAPTPMPEEPPKVPKP